MRGSGGWETTPSHFATRELGDGVYAAIAQDGGHALCNSGIVDLGGSTLVFDSFLTPEAGAELLEEAERLTHRTPEFVVNSHWHGDHIRGNQAFPGAWVLSTNRTRELILTNSASELADDLAQAPEALSSLDAPPAAIPSPERPLYRGWYEGILHSASEVKIVPPNLTFESRLSLRGQRRTVELVSYGGGHTASDAFLYLPEERVAFLGDLVSVGYHPFLTSGNPEELVRILEKIRDLHPQQIIPGHGPPGTLADVGVMRAYVQGALKLAHELKFSGAGRERARKLSVPPEYREWKFSRFYAESLLFLFDRFAALSP